MTTLRGACATLDWSLLVDCPNCSEKLDLVDYDSDNDYHIAKYIFTNDWEKLQGYEVTCPKCKQDFTLEKIEY